MEINDSYNNYHGPTSNDVGNLLRGIAKGKGFEYNHKIMIIRFKSSHLISWLLENLWSVRV
jgi:hypothetical protein